MKFTIVTLALIAASVSADVSHLNREYLPPVQSGSLGSASVNIHHHAEYHQQADEIPAAIGADTYTPAHLIEQQETVISPVHEVITNTIEEAVAPINIGADTYTPEHLIEKETLVVENKVRPGYDASSHTPAHLIETNIRPGYDASSHTPAHLLDHGSSHQVESHVSVTKKTSSITPAIFVAQKEVQVALPETNPIAEQTVHTSVISAEPVDEHINAPLPLSVDPVAQYVQAQTVQHVQQVGHVQHGQLLSSGIDTKYAPNGGYVY